MKEVWRDIVGFEDLYEISNLGRVRSLIQVPSKIMSPSHAKGDYVSVILCKNKKRYYKKVHRLVYETFRGEIYKDFEVHHIDGNKHNNRIDNLTALRKKTHRKVTLKENPNITANMVARNINQPIMQYSKDGEFIAEYQNAKVASKITGVCQRNICQAAKGVEGRTQAGGYIWRRKV